MGLADVALKTLFDFNREFMFEDKKWNLKYLVHTPSGKHKLRGTRLVYCSMSKANDIFKKFNIAHT